MPKVSRETATVDDYGIVEDRHTELENYTASFVTFRQAVDSAPMLKGLPGDLCQAPHWGYVLKGTVIFGYPDGTEERCEVGDAFYAPAPHTSRTEADTEYLQFSPTRELRIVEENIMRNMQGTDSS
jgi:hypothetical protein